MPLLENLQTRTTIEQQALLTALDRSMGIIEFTSDGKVLSANRNYLEIFGYQEKDLCRLYHRSFCSEQYANSKEFNDFWTSLQQGQFFSGLCQRVTADGCIVWLEATYNPVFDNTGELIKIIKFASDITTRVQNEQSERARTHLFTLIADRTHNAMLITDHEGISLYINDAYSRLFGYKKQEILGLHVSSLVNMANTQENSLNSICEHLLSGKNFGAEELIYSKSNQPLWCKLSGSPIFDSQGYLTNTVIIFNDITETKMREMLWHKTLEAMVCDSPLTEVLNLVCREVERIAPEVITSILSVDEQGKLHFLAGPSLPKSYSQAQNGVAIGDNVGSCGTAAFLGIPVLVCDIANDPLWTDFKDIALPLGLRACWSTPIKAKNNKVVGAFAFYYKEIRAPHDFHKRLVEVSTHLCSVAMERENARLQIRHLAFYDSLTGLPNRRLLLTQADQAITIAKHDHQSLTVLFIDLDRFKQVNDSLGHPAGDELLCLIAQRLGEEVRSTDILGRLSGDEFIIVLNPCTLAQATDTVERLHERLSRPCQISGVTLAPSVSIGISHYPENGQDIETLIHRADLAMYRAKTSCRGRFSFFSNEMNLVAQERLKLETALREALKVQGLHLHYQPQVDLKSGQVYGVEALARWTDPQFGEISPTRFIPLAEECGLIGELGLWALSESCRQLSEWRRQGLRVPIISVNLSPKNFHNLALPQLIAQALNQNALMPSDLTLEITESLLLEINPDIMRTLHEIHDMGVSLALDDFGTGYSSLSYLRHIPINTLKLDKSFVNGIEHDEAARALTKAVIGIGESLNLTVIAEGVVNEPQHLLLSAQGYKIGQGYLFSRPLPPGKLADWLKYSKLLQ